MSEPPARAARHISSKEILIMKATFAAVLLAFAPVASSWARNLPVTSRPNVATVSPPSMFEPNRGQSDPTVRFLARAAGYSVLFTDQAAEIAPTGAVPIRMTVVGSQRTCNEVEEPTGGISNYFLGSDKSKWLTKIPQYRQLRRRDMLPGIDEIFHAAGNLVEFDFVVAPGAAPETIELAFQNAKAVALDDAGDLLLSTADGEVRISRPKLYQKASSSTRIEMIGAYALSGTRVSLIIPAYDRAKELVIDPVISYSTYLGGASIVASVAADAGGNAYMVGAATNISGQPSLPIANPVSLGNGFAGGAFVSKMKADGSALLYLTFIGGIVGGAASDFNNPQIAVDATGSAYITGSGYTGLPIVAAFQSQVGGGPSDAFVSKLSPDGSALVYSTLLGGKGNDLAHGIAVDSAGNAYVAGSTTSTDFPILNQFQASLKGTTNAFVSKFSPRGSLVYSTYLGGNGSDSAQGVAVDGQGNAIISGDTTSTTFPIVNPFQKGAAGGAFVTKLSANGSTLIYSTFLGGPSDQSWGIAADAAGDAFVTGSTVSPAFPTKNAFQPNFISGRDGYVTKLDSSGALVYSTYLGGPVTLARAIAIDSSGDAYVTGEGSVPLQNPLIPTSIFNNVVYGSFVAELDPSGSTLLFSTYWGTGYGIAVTPGGDILVGGAGSILPKNAIQTVGGPAFISKISPGTGPPAINPAGVVPVFSTASIIQPGSWVSIYGTNLATGIASWNGDFPTSLLGTSVTINGKSAALWFVSPGQINLQAPDDATTGPVNVVVTTPIGTVTSTVTLSQIAPSLSLLDSKYCAAIILRSDGSGSNGGGTYDIVGPAGTSLGYKTVPAKAGDTLVLFGVGFGPTNPVVASGKAFSGSAPTTNSVQILINGTAVLPFYSGLTGAGLYQFNLVLPTGLGTGDVTLQATVGGVRSPAGVVISLQ
jgi:uncharacterized protein (TIGR03437 family)